MVESRFVTDLLFFVRMKRTPQSITRRAACCLLILAAATMLAACRGDKRPDGVIPPVKMSEFLTEAYLIEAYSSVTNPTMRDSIGDDIRAAYDDLLERQGLTKEQVELSFDYYAHRPDQYEKILNDVLYRLEDPSVQVQPQVNAPQEARRK